MRRVAIVQMVSVADVKTNLDQLEPFFDEAAQKGAELIVLPENFALMGVHETDKLACAESEGEGIIQNTVCTLASKYQLWVIAGTIPLKAPDGRVWASSLVFDSTGTQVARYDKIHLFDVAVSAAETYAESHTIAPGKKTVVVDTPLGCIGLSVCYDLRFPELYRKLMDDGAELFTVVAAFTETTGRAHWHALLKARAIENMCYLLASNQGGVHANGRETYGHSMLINPWGEMIAEIKHGTGMICADVDLKQLHRRRTTFPCLRHRVL